MTTSNKTAVRTAESGRDSFDALRNRFMYDFTSRSRQNSRRLKASAL